MKVMSINSLTFIFKNVLLLWIIINSDNNVELSSSNIIEFLENFTASIEEVNVGYSDFRLIFTVSCFDHRGGLFGAALSGQ